MFSLTVIRDITFGLTAVRTLRSAIDRGYLVTEHYICRGLFVPGPSLAVPSAAIIVRSTGQQNSACAG